MSLTDPVSAGHGATLRGPDGPPWVVGWLGTDLSTFETIEWLGVPETLEKCSF